MSDTPRTDAVLKENMPSKVPNVAVAMMALGVHAYTLERENRELLEALKGMLECMEGCDVFIHSRQKINQQEGPEWIAAFTDKARAAIAKAEGRNAD